ncbi:InlB B-repeat-containing protein [Paenibacillus sp. WLX2291]|uniref:InlB B-repeat-containing protein n=1 Tax=Paenibacillus sp. WLX2291 TaxID=3296934 RepID=UPI003983F9E1
MIHYAWRASWKIALVFILAFVTLSAGSYTARQAQAAAGNPYIGEIALFPYNFAPYGWSFAAGQSMQITSNAALYSLLGNNYGGDGRSSFNLPNLTSAPVPDGMGYYIATTGIYPSREDGNSAGNAMRGEVRMFPYNFVPGDWLKLNGQQLSTSAYPALYSLIGSATDTGSTDTFTLPSLASPLPNTPLFFAVSPSAGGAQSGNNIGNGTGDEYMGETIPFLSNMQSSWITANGGLLFINSNMALYSLLYSRFGGDGMQTFGTPNMQSNPYSLHYYTVSNGIYPSRDGGGGPNSLGGSTIVYSVSQKQTLNISSSSLLTGVDARGVSLRTQASHGKVTDTGSGFTYVPVSTYVGADSFTIRTYNYYGFANGYSTINIDVQAALPPVVTGVVDQQVYNTPVTPVTNGTTVLLNGNYFASGTPVTKEGNYTLISANLNGSTTVHFTIDLTPPAISGVQDGGRYTSPPTITFNEGTVLLNNVAFSSGGKIETEGNYTLIATDAVGNVSRIAFSYYKPRQVTFDSAGGTVVSTQSLYYGDLASEPPLPTRTGYNFTGWYTDAAHTQRFDFNKTVIHDNLALYADWAVQAYPVSFDTGGGPSMPNTAVSYGEPLAELSPPARTGYTFAGWYSDAAHTQRFNFQSLITGPTALYAAWTINRYTVTFDSNGGVPISSQQLDYGSTVSQPTMPTRTGYDFTGWYKDAQTSDPFDFAQTVLSDSLDLYAGWKIQSYKVSFDDGAHIGLPDVNINYGGNIQRPTDPLQAGHTFTGWYRDAAHTQLFDFQALITAPTTLYAGWDVNRYNVSFDSNGGDPVSGQQLNYGSIVNEPAAPTRTGYDFTGWYTDAAHTHPFDFAQTVLNDNLHLYAGWTIQSYKVSFDVYAQAGVPDIKINYGGTIQRPADPVQAGHTFTGWYRDAARTQPFDFQALITGATTIYAGWDINRYHVSFDSNGGEPVSDQQLNYGNAVSEPTAPTRTGYTFKGWYSDTDLKHTYSFGVLPISSDVQLYAGWERNRYTVNFDTYGGTVVNDVYIGYGDLLTTPGIPIANRDGMIFAGWFADTNHNQPFDFSQPIVANVILYAKWALRVQQITFDTDGGTNVGGQSAAYGDRLSRPADPVRTGYDFDGWYSDADHQQRFDFATDTATSDLTLHAKWTLSVYRILYDMDGGTAVQEGSAHYGDLLSRPNDPTRSGYTFTGWYADAAHSQPFTFADHRIIADLRLYAGWQVNAPTDGGNTGGNGGGQGSSSNGQSTIRSTNGRVIIPVGRAGEVRLGSGVLLEVPQGAAGQPLDIQVKLISTPAEGLASTVHTISPIYEFTKNMQDNFSVPVKLTLQYDPSSIQTGETVAVFYQTAEGAPWVQVEGGDVKGSDISVSVNHFTRFAVMAVQAASTDQGNTAPTNSATNGTTGNEGSAGKGTTNFSDIAGHWAADSIRAAATLGIAKGYADGTFHPVAKVTRAEFAVMLMRALPSGDQTVSDATLPFADQASIGSWAKADIATAYKLGWIKGDANGTFRPNASITRAEMAVMISNALASSATAQQTAGTTATFGDQQQIPAWAQAAAASLKQQGLLNGRADGHFDPSASTTRAEAAQVLMNARKEDQF